MLATQDVTVGPASADPPALALRAGGTALVSIEPEELSYSPASSSSQDSSPELIRWRRHALPGNFDRVCSDRPGDYGAGLRDDIAELYRILGRLDEPGSIGRVTRRSAYELFSSISTGSVATVCAGDTAQPRCAPS